MNRRGDREKPPNEPGGWRKWLQSTNSALDRIAALSVFALLGRDGQTHLLVQRPADESANAVRLPVCCLHNFSQGSPVSAGPGFARSCCLRGGQRLPSAWRPSWPGALSFLWWPLLALPLAGATWAPSFATRAFLVAFGGSPVAVAGAGRAHRLGTFFFGVSILRCSRSLDALDSLKGSSLCRSNR